MNKLSPKSEAEAEDLREKISALEADLIQEKERQELLKDKFDAQIEDFRQIKSELESNYSDLKDQMGKKDAEIESLRLQVILLLDSLLSGTK